MASGVEFDEDNMGFGRPGARPGVPGSIAGKYGGVRREEKGMAGWLIRHGLAKSYASAQFVMIGVVIVNIIITYVVIKFILL